MTKILIQNTKSKTLVAKGDNNKLRGIQEEIELAMELNMEEKGLIKERWENYHRRMEKAREVYYVKGLLLKIENK